MNIGSCGLACLSVVAALISLSCGGPQSTAAEQSTATSKLPFGYVESPHPGETVRGQWPVQGWALSESGVKTVDIFVDRAYVGTAQVGVSRPDVEKAYPNIKNAGVAGWTYTLDVSAVSPGAHELIVQARSNESRTRDLGTIPLTVSR